MMHNHRIRITRRRLGKTGRHSVQISELRPYYTQYLYCTSIIQYVVRSENFAKILKDQSCAFLRADETLERKRPTKPPGARKLR